MAKDNRVFHIEIRGTEKFAWVVDPDIPQTRYVKTHRCVYYTPCPRCNAAIGVPCVGTYGKTTATVHDGRRDVFYERITREAAQENLKHAQPLKRLRGGKAATA